MSRALTDVALECAKRELSSQPVVDLPDGTDSDYEDLAYRQQVQNEIDEAEGQLSWHGVLMRHVLEAIAKQDTRELRAKLVTVASLAISWAECIDQRSPKASVSGTDSPS